MVVTHCCPAWLCFCVKPHIVDNLKLAKLANAQVRFQESGMLRFDVVQLAATQQKTQRFG